MKNIIKYSFIYLSCLIIFNCASIGLPGGGPADENPPYLITSEIFPVSNLNIDSKQSISLLFNERLFPTFLKSLIRIEPDTEIKIENRSDKIIITPKEIWPEQFIINISRGLSDYNMNELLSPIQLIYSRIDTIAGDTIRGSLFNFNSEKTYDIAIINNKNDSIISMTQSDINGDFKFLGYNPNSNDFILALENKIKDEYKEKIRLIRYGLSSKGIDNSVHEIYISSPIYRESIIGLNLINNKYGEILLSSGKELDLFLNDDYYRSKNIIDEDQSNVFFIEHYFLDTLHLELTLKNQVEEYTITKSFKLSSDYNDIVSPTVIEDIQCKNDSILNISFRFSEPVILGNPFKIYNPIDSIYISEVSFKQSYPNKIETDDFIRSHINKLYVDCNDIRDLNENSLCDSTLIIDINKNCEVEEEIEEEKFGEINGSINYSGLHKLKVLASKKVDKNEIQEKDIIDNNKFKLILEPGKYRVWVHEDINQISGAYFSGTLNPFKRAAKFSVYRDSIKIRANWSNTINMELK